MCFTCSLVAEVVIVDCIWKYLEGTAFAFVEIF